MLTVKECTIISKCEEISKKFGAPYNALDRAFALYGGEPIGIGILGLDKGIVVIKYISDCGGAQNFDLLARSILFFIKDFNPIMVRADCHQEYFFRFGFANNGGATYIMSDKIDFICMGDIINV